MKRFFCVLFLMLGLFGAPAVYGQAVGLVLSLELEPDHTLPGLPVAFRLRAANTSANSIPVPRSIVLRVTPSSGPPFLAAALMNSTVSTFASVYGEDPVVNAGETKTFFFPINPSLGPEWFADRGLSMPGRYRLQLVLGSGFGESASLEKLDSGGYPGARFSSEAVMTIDEPKGEDAIVWKRMLEITDNQGWGMDDWTPELADEIWNQHPQSSYAPYSPYVPGVLTGAYSEEAHSAFLNDYLEKYPDNPLSDWIRLGRLRSSANDVYRAVDTDRNLARALERREGVLRDAEALARSTRNDVVRLEAEKIAQDLPSPEGLSRYDQGLKKFDTPAPVPPPPSCGRMIVATVHDAISQRLSSSETSAPARDKLEDVQQDLGKYFEEANREQPNWVAALGALEGAAGNLEAMIKDKLLDSTAGNQLTKGLIEAAALTAQKSIAVAESDPGADRGKIQTARQKYAEGEVLRGSNLAKAAIAKFKDAVSEAQSASSARVPRC